MTLSTMVDVRIAMSLFCCCEMKFDLYGEKEGTVMITVG